MSKTKQEELFSTDKISASSKKNEIFEAYQELLAKVSETKQVSHQEIKQKQEEITVVNKATEFKVDKIIANIADVKLTVSQNLDTLEQRLVSEYRRLQELREAIILEVTELEEIHQIRKNVNTLEALLLAQKEYRARFEEEMEDTKKSFDLEVLEKRIAWKKEQEEADIERKERTMRIKKEREREEEEYTYAITLERKKSEDAYAARQSALEKELEDKKIRVNQDLKNREEAIVAAETELKTLKNQVDKFPHELENAIANTEKETRESLERMYKHQIELSTAEIEGERKLKNQTISMLQAKIKEQEEFIHQLTQKTDDATHQVQTIALKALEGSSFHRYYPAMDEGKQRADER